MYMKFIYHFVDGQGRCSCFIRSLMSFEFSVKSVNAVSYTHLDVYKRQVEY